MAKNTALAAYKAGERARRKGRHHRPRMTLSLAVLAGLAPTAIYAIDGFRQGGVTEGGARVIARMTGYSITERKWKLDEILAFWLPLGAGIIVHKLANRLGINRMIGRAIPVLRI